MIDLKKFNKNALNTKIISGPTSLVIVNTWADNIFNWQWQWTAAQDQQNDWTEITSSTSYNVDIVWDDGMGTSMTVILQ